MHRRKILVAAPAAVLASCQRSREGAAPALPELVAEKWRRGEIRSLGQDYPLPAARQLAVRQVWKATYAGPAPIEVFALEMPTPSAAFELLQRSRVETGVTLLRRAEWVFALHTGEISPQQALPFLRDFGRQTGAGI